MSVLSDNYKRIMSEVEAKITNPEDQEFVKQKISELSVVFMDIIDNLSNITEQKIKNIEAKQQQIENKMQEMENYVNDIENDMIEEIEAMDEEINEDDEEYEFEIVCPYCDNEFISDINGKTEVTCPECNNIIELDWNDEEEKTSGCAHGGCGACHGCSVEPNNIKEQEENDDDM